MTLTERAQHLNSRHRTRWKLPAVLLLTDEVRLPNPLPAAATLPRGGAGVILRHYGDPGRAELAVELAELCRRRGLSLLVAGDGALAMRIGAHGVHFPEARAGEARRWRRSYPGWLITAAAHSRASLFAAARAGADAALLGPVFATVSHPDAQSLGPVRFAALVRTTTQAFPDFAVYALGGVTVDSVGRLMGSGAAGVAAISGLAAPRADRA